MPKKPNIAALAEEWLSPDEGEGKDHPLQSVIKDEFPGRIVFIPVDLLFPNPDQPRKHFDEDGLKDLAASVKDKGILQPVIARKDKTGDGYILIAGERRWRAAKAAALKEIPALIRGEEDALEIALIENLQREDLSALDEAEALLKLKEARNYTDELLAKMLGKSRQSVGESLSLNKLPKVIKDECRTPNDRHPSKIQLLQVLRAGSPEKIQSAWEALKTGEARTVRDLKKRAKPAKGRPKNYTFSYTPKHRRFRLTLTFHKPKVLPREVKAALREALNQKP